MRSGRVHARHFALVRAWRQVLIEAGGSIPRRNVERMLRNCPLRVPADDNRRMDLLVHGLSIFGGLPLYCDVTCVSPITGAGLASSGCLESSGGAVRRAHVACHRHDYPDVASSGVGRLCSLGVEVFGLWDADSLSVVRNAARARCAGLSRRVRLGTNFRLLRRWFGLLGMAVQSAVAYAILEGAGADVPLDTWERGVPPGDLPEQ